MLSARNKPALPFSPFLQLVCPAPKRHLQQLIVEKGLRTGLDIGCGDFSCLTPLRSSGFRATGIDTCAETIESCKVRNTHDSYRIGNFLDADFNETFDVVVMSHVIEHFDRDTGMAALRKVESLARRLAYVETPNGFLEQHAMLGNSFQRHLSGWFPHDFEARAYTVYGSGPRFLIGPMGIAKLRPASFARLLSRLLQFHYYRRPQSAHTIAAFRYLDEEGSYRRV